MSLLQINKVVEGTIDTIAFGGEGILRHEGFVIFVPFTAIGDRITCKIVEAKKSFARAELVSIIEPSPQRTTPRCPYFGRCGGCQLQHLNEDGQNNYKKHAVIDALRRIGHLQVDSIAFVPATLKWAYRRHISLHLRPHKNHFQAGYIANDNHSLVIIDTCPIFNSPEDSIIQSIQKFVQRLPNPQQQSGRVTILKNHENEYIVSFHFPKEFEANPVPFKNMMELYPNIAGVLLNRGNQEIVWGNPYSEITLEGLKFRFTPQSFIQNHPEQSTNIYQKICELSQSSTKKKILDLYCGFGITSLLLAQQGHDVTGVEQNKEAIQFANENARRNQLVVKFIQDDVEKALPRLASDFVIVNPPRTGMTKRVSELLVNLNADKIIYVSCMPATLARDLALLCQYKYEIEECVAFDMFPQTAHVETVVCLKKTSIGI